MESGTVDGATHRDHKHTEAEQVLLHVIHEDEKMHEKLIGEALQEKPAEKKPAEKKDQEQQHVQHPADSMKQAQHPVQVEHPIHA